MHSFKVKYNPTLAYFFFGFTILILIFSSVYNLDLIVGPIFGILGGILTLTRPAIILDNKSIAACNMYGIPVKKYFF